MSGGQVADMNVVAQAGAIRRRIVVAEHLKPRAPGRRVDRSRDDVNLRRMIFADFAVGIGTRGVEIAKRHEVNAVRALEMRERSLDGQLGFAIAVDGTLRMRLGDRSLDRLTVCGA